MDAYQQEQAQVRICELGKQLAEAQARIESLEVERTLLQATNKHWRTKLGQLKTENGRLWEALKRAIRALRFANSPESAMVDYGDLITQLDAALDKPAQTGEAKDA